MDLRKKIVNSYKKFMKNTNNIDRLMTDKLDDFVLLEEPPMPVQLGNKVIFVGTFNFKNEDKFFHQWAMILSAMSSRLINLELADERRKELMEQCNFDLLANGKYMLEFIWMDNWLKDKLCGMIGDTLLKQKFYIYNEVKGNLVMMKWKNCSYKYFRENMTSEKLIQICYLIYIYNFDSQKKSLRVLVDRLNMKHQEETYIPYWLENLAGLTGKFLTAPLPDIASYYKESQSKERTKTKGVNNGEK